jgi:hypothetical protein
MPPLISDKINSTMKIKKKILAILAEAPAIPPKPKTPAIIATIMNVIVQRNIIMGF